jgi:hypothetical protein
MDTHKIIDDVFGVKRALIGVVHTGGLPGTPASERSVDEIIERKVATLVGSGVTLENLHDYDQADALIVGSSVKQGGIWSGALDHARVRALAVAFNR